VSSIPAGAPTSKAALTSGWTALFLAVFTLLVLAIAGPGYRAGILSLNPAFMLLLLAMVGAVLSLVVGLVAVPWNLRRGSRGLALASLAALLLGLGLSLHFANWIAAGRAVPPIHDITTDTRNPPEFVDILPLREGAPNAPGYAGGEVAALQLGAYPDLAPLRIEAPAGAVFAAAVNVVQRLGWELVTQAPGEGRIEATASTWYFGFKDDVVIRLRREDEQLVIVDVRSKSRVGVSDVGANAARIRAFRDGLLSELQ